MNFSIDMNLWLLFFVIFAATGIVPGPNVAYTVAQSLKFGFSRTISVPIGFAIGTVGHAIIVLSGVGLLVQKFGILLTIIKWVGVCFLIYLAFKSFTSKTSKNSIVAEDLSFHQLLFGAILVSFTNPKGIIASIIIYPTFVNDSLPFLPQAIILGVTGMLLSFFIYLLYAYLSSRSRVLFNNQTQINKIVGCIYVFVAFWLGFI